MKLPWKKRKPNAEIAALQRELLAKENQITYLVQTIRQMDDKIFSMGQCTSWESMRPRFAQLHDEMTARKVAESNRISSLLIPELNKTYTPADGPKLLERKQ